jgi:tRNA A-37 threonylcarbamoyl transferase component Bud32
MAPSDPTEAPGGSETQPPDAPPNPTLKHGPVVRHAGRLVAGFELIDRLDRDSGNAFGEVWLAQSREPFQRVAIKFVRPDRARPEIVRRFTETESSAMARLNHPYIAQFKQFGFDQGEPFIVMEYVPGDPICSFCDKHRLGVSERVALMAKVCDAVQAIHAANLIHRDLKPQNILVTWDRSTPGSEPTPKLIDFGLARSDNPDAPIAASVVTQMGFVGTMAYASPEQHQKLRADEIGKEADVYALGSVLFELLTGVTPVHGFSSDRQRAPGEIEELLRTADRPAAKEAFTALGDARERIAAQRGTTVDGLTELLGSRLTHVLDKALRFQASDRFSSARVMGSDLRAILEERDFTEAATESRWERTRRTYRRHRPIWIAVAAAATALIVGAVATTWLWITAARERDTTERTLVFLTGVLDPPDDLGPQEMKLVDVIRASMPAIDGSFDGQPHAEARVRIAMARSAASTGSFELAGRLAQRAQELADSVDDAVLLAEARQVSLEITTRQNLMSGTVKDAEAVLAELLKSHGPDDPVILGTKLQVANAHKKIAKEEPESMRRAAQLYDELLEQRTRLDGPKALTTLIVRHNRNLLDRIEARGAVSDERAGSLERVLKAREAICTDTESALGSDHWQAIASRAEWLGLLAEAQRLPEALDGYPKLLDAMQASLGPAHWRTIETTARFGRALMQDAEAEDDPEMLEAAADHLANALEGYRRFNPRTDDHLHCARLLIECLERQGSMAAAAWYLERTERLLAQLPDAAPGQRAPFKSFAADFRGRNAREKSIRP